MKGQGYSARAIARELGLARNTVLKYLRSPDAMRPKPRPPRGSILDPYAQHIDRRTDCVTRGAPRARGGVCQRSCGPLPVRGPGHAFPAQVGLCQLGFQLADVIGRHLRALPPAGIHDPDQRKIRLGKVQRLTDSGAVASIAALETRMLRASADPVGLPPAPGGPPAGVAGAVRSCTRGWSRTRIR